MINIGTKIREAAKKMGLTQPQLSEMMGKSVGLVNMWLTGKRDIGTEDMYKICQILKISPNYLFEQETDTIPVIGYVQAGLWQEATQWHISDFKPIYMPMDEKFKGKRIYALEVRGNSMNLIYPAGSCVVCVSAEDYTDIVGTIESGKKVIVERRNPMDGSIEATVKEYVKNTHGTFLRPRSTDSSFQPIRTDDGTAGEVKITGVVIGMFRKE